jgi:hypothetical protein
MRTKFTVVPAILLTILLVSFVNKEEIDQCYISFKTATNLIVLQPDRRPDSAEKTRVVETENGKVEVTCIDGYRLIYRNEKTAPFVNLKVELSKADSYEADQKNLIENLNYLNTHSTNMETKELIELQFNGYKIYGLSRGSIEVGSTLGTFVMFPGNGVTVYFYFNNLKPEFRHFESVEDYKKLRDKFMDEYTKYLNSCRETKR